MHPRFVRSIRAQPRLVSAVILGVVLYAVLPGDWEPRLVAAWDGATGLYLVLVAAMMGRSGIEKIRLRAAAQDEGRMVVLALTTIPAVVSLVGVMVELARAKNGDGPDRWQHIALGGVTVLLSWAFLHTVFAVHYAHEFYSGHGSANGRGHGLDFPGDEPPDYWDFVYYAFTLGTACATSDVDVTGRRIRRITTYHSVVAFFFNTTTLALTVNIGASFF